MSKPEETLSYTGGQLFQLINLVNQKSPTLNGMKNLLESGIVSEILEGRESVRDRTLGKLPVDSRWSFVDKLASRPAELHITGGNTQCARKVSYSYFRFDDTLFCDGPKTIEELAKRIQNSTREVKTMAIKIFTFGCPHTLSDATRFAPTGYRPGKIEDIVTWGHTSHELIIAGGDISCWQREHGRCTLAVPAAIGGIVQPIPADRVFAGNHASWIYVKPYEEGDLV